VGPCMQDDTAKALVGCKTPRALRLEEPSPTSRSLTSSVASWVLTRELHSRVRGRLPVLRRVTTIPGCQDPENAARFRTSELGAQDAFRRFDARPCDRVKLVASPVTVRAAGLAPLSPDTFELVRVNRISSRRAVLLRLPSVRLSALLWRVEKMLRTDLCNRHSTTSTQQSLDFRALGLRRAFRRALPRPRSSSPVRCPTALRRSDPGWARA